MLQGGDAKKDERKKKAKKKKGGFGGYDPWAAMAGEGSMITQSKGSGGGGEGGWNSVSGGGGVGGGWGKWFKEWVNTYSITMDIKIHKDEEIGRDGLSLFQTQLLHTEENSKTGKKIIKQTDGECSVNQAGGVGTFGTFGDVTRAKVEVGQWKRVVISVKCAAGGNKGEMRTWVDTEPGVVLKDEAITAEGRFAIDPEGLFLFSSAKPSMMPGAVLGIIKYFSVKYLNITKILI